MWVSVNTILTEVPVNIAALIDDTDFKTREQAVTYDQAGLDLLWNFVTTAGVFTQTAVTPTDGGAYAWTNQGNGMYTIRIPAVGGSSINNNAVGFGWFSGYADGILPWIGPVIEFRDTLDVRVTSRADLLQLQMDEMQENIEYLKQQMEEGLPGLQLSDQEFDLYGNIYGNLAGTVGSLATQAKEDVNNEVVDAINVDTYAEPGQETPAATNTLVKKIGYLFKAWRNKIVQDNSTYELYNDDAATVDQKATVSDDGTDFTKGEIESGP